MPKVRNTQHQHNGGDLLEKKKKKTVAKISIWLVAHQMYIADQPLEHKLLCCIKVGLTLDWAHAPVFQEGETRASALSCALRLMLERTRRLFKLLLGEENGL